MPGMKTQRWLVVASLGLAAVVVGCANPGIVAMSQNTYMLVKQDRGGIFGNIAALKAEVIQEANSFAASQGKVAVPIAAKDTSLIPGVRFASFEYQFRLVDPSDPAARQGSLMPRPDMVIENTGKTTVEVINKDSGKKDVYADLMKLDDLRKRGILSDEEFTAQKKKLLLEN